MAEDVEKNEAERQNLKMQDSWQSVKHVQLQSDYSRQSFQVETTDSSVFSANATHCENEGGREREIEGGRERWRGTEENTEKGQQNPVTLWNVCTHTVSRTQSHCGMCAHTLCQQNPVTL